MSANTEKDTTERLRRLRKVMNATTPSIAAYLITQFDTHERSRVSECDARFEYMTKFIPASGLAVVTQQKAAVWVDGRFYVHAALAIDKNWTIFNEGLPGVPSIFDWLSTELGEGSTIGVDINLLSKADYEVYLEKFEGKYLKLIDIQPNLVDKIWTNKPPRPKDPIVVHPIQFAGADWQDKVTLVRGKMTENKASVLVEAALERIAWMLNLRGNDISFNPLFLSYIIVTIDSIYLFVDSEKVTAEVRAHLKLDTESSNNNYKVILKPYDSVQNELKAIVNATANQPNNKVWISPLNSNLLFASVPKDRQLKMYSPINQYKCAKNIVEIEGMKRCNLRDDLALCEFMCWLEKEIRLNKKITELDALRQVEAFRKRREHYISFSFRPISCSGPHSSLVLYSPTPETDRLISKEELFLFDYGAHYSDGTTDLARVLHFGAPTEFEKECYTKILQGHILLDGCCFPSNTQGTLLDSQARLFLWKEGLDYHHATGHGVGFSTEVEEHAYGIGSNFIPGYLGIVPGMVVSNEPGYYHPNKFGIRLENLLLVIEAQTHHNIFGIKFCKFERLNYVPFETKLIKKELMTASEIKWLNDYHAMVRERTGTELLNQGLKEVHGWLMTHTQPI